MGTDNYTPKTFVFRWELENYITYLRSMNASEQKIEEMTKNIVVIELEVNNGDI